MVLTGSREFLETVLHSSIKISTFGLCFSTLVVEKYMPPDKRNFLGFCLYNFFALLNANRMAFSHPEYVAECQLALWQSDCLQVEAKGHLPSVLKCSEMCSEFCKVPFSSSESSSLNSSPWRALRAFLLPLSCPLHGLSQYVTFRMELFLLPVGWSALFSL